MSDDSIGPRRHHAVHGFASALRRFYGTVRASLTAYANSDSPWLHGTSRYHVVTKSMAETLDGEDRPTS